MKKAVYLDFAAATPLDTRVLQVMQPYHGDQFYNPSALYLASRAVKKDLEGARSVVAQELGARPSEIVFVAGGSEANNLAIKGIMAAYPDKKLLISPLEHESVRAPAQNYNHSELKVDKYGQIDLAQFKKQLNDDVILVSIIYASNEVGTVQAIAKLSQVIKETIKNRTNRGIDTPLYFHTDACQAVQYLNLHVERLGVDLMTINGGKIYGPKQSAVLYVRGGIVLAPIIEGGGQEKNRRSGTENVPAFIGLTEALKTARAKAKTESIRVSALRDKLKAGLEAVNSSIIFHGHPERRTPNHLAFSVPGRDNERLMMELDEQGFMVATGSACSASKNEASHALLAIGVSDSDAHSSLRITLGRTTTDAQIEALVQAFQAILK